MFRFANYVFGTDVETNVNNENIDLNQCTEEDIDDDWILIDVHFDDNYKKQNDINDNNGNELQAISANFKTTTNRVPQNSSDAQPLHSTDSNEGQSKGDDCPDDPSSAPYQGMEESWFVTPPPCFNSVSNPVVIETTPLENLLIEHPSMSVFGPSLPPNDHHLPLSESDMSSNDITLPLTQTMSRRQIRQLRRQHNSAQNRDVNQSNVNLHLHLRTAVLDELHVLSSMQSQEVFETRKLLTKCNLERQNKVLVQRNKPQTRRSKMTVRPNGVNNNRKNC